MKFSASLSIAVAIAFTVIAAATSHAATSTVCATGCSFTTIAAAIAGSASGDVISITDAVHDESNIEVSQTVTIEGQSAAATTVDGGASGPIFTVDSGVAATIENLTISNGGGSFGGAILNQGGAVTLHNVTISGCTVFDYGSAVFNAGGTVTISNSTLSGNTAFLYGGAIYTTGGTVSIANSTLSGNSAFNFGGAVFNAGGTLTITGSTLSGNSADNFGGGVFNADTAALVNDTFSGNSAGYGGAIFDSGALAASNITVSGNTATFAGGGVYGAATVKNSIIGNNAGGDCGFAPVALGANLDSDGTCGSVNFIQASAAQLNLGALALNAPGETETMALNQGSVAIDAAADCTDAGGNAVTVDQRGLQRHDLNEAACDAGAYEYQDAAPEFAGTPGEADCSGKSISALAQQDGGIAAAAAALGYPDVKALKGAIRSFCG